MGPAPPKRSKDEWTRSLASSDLAQKLATMVWLSGGHLPSTKPRTAGESQEPLENSRVFESVRDSRETIDLLRDFVNSKNKWIQDYAKLCLEPSE
jgi:hypothetical protein